MYKYAVTTSYSEMEKIIKVAEEDLNNEELKKEVNYRVGTFLHWLLDYYEYIEKTCNQKISENDSLFFMV